MTHQKLIAHYAPLSRRETIVTSGAFSALSVHSRARESIKCILIVDDELLQAVNLCIQVAD